MTSKLDFLISASRSLHRLISLTVGLQCSCDTPIWRHEIGQLTCLKYICRQMDDPSPTPQMVPPAPKSAFDVMMAVRRCFPTSKSFHFYEFILMHMYQIHNVIFRKGDAECTHKTADPIWQCVLGVKMIY